MIGRPLVSHVAVGRIGLAAAAVAIACVWLAVLPWASRQASIESHLDWLDAQRVDPSALFYTDLHPSLLSGRGRDGTIVEIDD
jgi:hypothetical protein